MVLPGSQKVLITATRDDPTKKLPGIEPGTTVLGRVQYIPAKYNKQTELKKEVGEDGDEFTFELKSK